MKSFECLTAIAARCRTHCAGLLCSLAVLCVFGHQAYATTLQEKFGVFSVNFLTGNTVTGALPAFNPSLGTLDSVAFTYQSSAVLLQGTAMSTRIAIHDSQGTLLTTINFPLMTGRDQQIQDGTFSAPAADLADFEGIGNVNLTLQGLTACRGPAATPTGCNAFSGAVGGQVSYAYTPTTVPEPNTIPLFSGVTGAFLVTRWRGATRQWRMYAQE
jgi:hypothetical protein